VLQCLHTVVPLQQSIVLYKLSVHAVCVKQTLVSGTHLTMDAGNYTQELGGQINLADVCLRCIISCFSYVHKMVLLNIATFCSVYHKGELESLLPFSIILLVGQQDLF